MMKRWALLGFALVALACAPHANPVQPSPDAGFWLGLWHGMTLPITFIVSLFNHNVGVYEVANNGGWYNFGFILGASGSLAGSGSAASSANRKE